MFQIHLSECLNHPINMRTGELANLFDRCTTKELQDYYPILINSIFTSPGNVTAHLLINCAVKLMKYVLHLIFKVGDFELQPENLISLILIACTISLCHWVRCFDYAIACSMNPLNLTFRLNTFHRK